MREIWYIFNIFGINMWYVLYFEYFRSKVESTFFFRFHFDNCNIALIIKAFSKFFRIYKYKFYNILENCGIFLYKSEIFLQLSIKSTSFLLVILCILFYYSYWTLLLFVLRSFFNIILLRHFWGISGNNISYFRE